MQMKNSSYLQNGNFGQLLRNHRHIRTRLNKVVMAPQLPQLPMVINHATIISFHPFVTKYLNQIFPNQSDWPQTIGFLTKTLKRICHFENSNKSVLTPKLKKAKK